MSSGLNLQVLHEGVVGPLPNLESTPRLEPSEQIEVFSSVLERVDLQDAKTILVERAARFVELNVFHRSLSSIPLISFCHIQIDIWIRRYKDFFEGEGVSLRLQSLSALQAWNNQNKFDDLVKALEQIQQVISRILEDSKLIKDIENFPKMDKSSALFFERELEVYSLREVISSQKAALQALVVFIKFVQTEESSSLLSMHGGRFSKFGPHTSGDKNTLRLFLYDQLHQASQLFYLSPGFQSWANIQFQAQTLFVERNVVSIASQVGSRIKRIFPNNRDTGKLLYSIFVDHVRRAVEEYGAFEDSEYFLSIEILDKHHAYLGSLSFLDAIEVDAEQVFIRRHQQPLLEFYDTVRQLHSQFKTFCPKVLRGIQDVMHCMLVYSSFTEDDIAELKTLTTKRIRAKVNQKIAEIGVIQTTNKIKYIELFMELRRQNSSLFEFFRDIKSVRDALKSFQAEYFLTMEKLFLCVKQQKPKFSAPTQVSFSLPVEEEFSSCDEMEETTSDLEMAVISTTEATLSQRDCFAQLLTLLDKKLERALSLSKAYHVKESLKNAQEHLRSMFTIMGRLIIGEESRSSLFSLLVDLHTDAHYLAEGMLAAIASHQLGCKDEESFSRLRVHNLKTLIAECKNSRDLMKKYWGELFQGIDRAEIFSRNIAGYAYEPEQNRLSKNSLSTMYLWSLGKSEESISQVMEESSKIFVRMISFFYDLLENFQISQPEEKLAFSTQVTQLLTTYKMKFSERADSQAHPYVAKIHEMALELAAKFSDSFTMEKGIENIRYNLLARLQTRLALSGQGKWEET